MPVVVLQNPYQKKRKKVTFLAKFALFDCYFKEDRQQNYWALLNLLLFGFGLCVLNW